MPNHIATPTRLSSLRAPSIIDSYGEENDTGNASGFNTTFTRFAQSFTNQTSSRLYSCQWYLWRVAFPSGSVYAKIYAHSGTYGTSSIPTGAALATSNPVDLSSLPSSLPGTLITFDFSNTNLITLSPTYYCVSIESTDCNVSNSVAIEYTNPGSSPPTVHSGNRSSWDNTTQVWIASAGDFIFYVYGTKVRVATPTHIG